MSSNPDLGAELRVDRGWFPYTVYLGDRKVLALYTSSLIPAIENTIKHFEATNDLIREYNLLLDVLNNRAKRPDDLKYKKLLQIPQEYEGDDFYKAHGVRLGQLWKTKGSVHHYEVIEVDLHFATITLSWIGTWKHERTIPVNQLKKRYELMPEANKHLIRLLMEADDGGFDEEDEDV